MSINLQALNILMQMNQPLDESSGTDFSFVIPITRMQTQLSDFKTNIYNMMVEFNYFSYELHFVGIKLNSNLKNEVKDLTTSINLNRSKNFYGAYFYQNDQHKNFGQALHSGVVNSHGSWILVLQSFDLKKLRGLPKKLDSKRQKMIKRQTKIFKDYAPSGMFHSNNSEIKLMKNILEYNQNNFGNEFRIYPKELLINCFKITKNLDQ